MSSKKFGYGRVSSKDQNEGRQRESFRELGIDDRDIFIDKQTGKDFEREKWQLVKHMLREGDILYIHSLDRMGRNRDGIVEEWKDITKNIKADIVVMDMPLLDTTKYRDSLGSFISDLVLQILSWIAEDERNRIRKRQREGIDLAIKNGVRLGRRKMEPPLNFVEVYGKWKAGSITALGAMQELKLRKSVFYRLVKEHEKKALE